METVVNDHYVRVKKWCASCEHREVDEEGTRICKLMQLRVKGDFVCPRWQLSSGLQNAVIELKLKTSLSPDTHKFESFMKKYIFILNAIELLKLLLDGKYVQGVLYMDQNTGRITFKAYNRQPRPREKDVLLKKLPWGWVKESVARIKVFGSFPKDVGTAQVMGLLEDNTRDAKNALIDRELIDFV